MLADAMERRLALEPGLEYAGCVQECMAALPTVRRSSVDLIILDIDMPGDSFELTRALGREFPGTKVVIFSGYVRNDYVDRAIDAGAWGYIAKSESMDVVIDSLARVAAGEFILSPDVMAIRSGGMAEDGGATDNAGAVA
jgi:two-component system response regulator DesR